MPNPRSQSALWPLPCSAAGKRSPRPPPPDTDACSHAHTGPRRAPSTDPQCCLRPAGAGKHTAALAACHYVQGGWAAREGVFTLRTWWHRHARITATCVRIVARRDAACHTTATRWVHATAARYAGRHTQAPRRAGARSRAHSAPHRTIVGAPITADAGCRVPARRRRCGVRGTSWVACASRRSYGTDAQAALPDNQSTKGSAPAAAAQSAARPPSRAAQRARATRRGSARRRRRAKNRVAIAKAPSFGC